MEKYYNLKEVGAEHNSFAVVKDMAGIVRAITEHFDAEPDPTARIDLEAVGNTLKPVLYYVYFDGYEAQIEIERTWLYL